MRKTANKLIWEQIWLNLQDRQFDIWEKKTEFNGKKNEVSVFILFGVMHQSIPAAPIPPPPRATAGHLHASSVPGVGH